MGMMKHLCKPTALATILLWVVGVSQTAAAQMPATWTWIGGSNTTNPIGVYGQLGVPSTGNIPSGRGSAASWTDNAGNFWLFGGEGYDGTNGSGLILNDLWKFSSSSNEWTWIGGSSTAATSSPGMYGMLGTPSTLNFPGSRSAAVTWTDGQGNLWLFGGKGNDASGNTGELNDVWEYTPAIKQWTWRGGSSSVGANGGRPGVYGILGIPTTVNIPGGRSGAMSWADVNGNLWLFGGEGYDSTGNEGELNDLWRFSPSVNEWAWMGGSSTTGANDSQHGMLGTSAIGNIPGSRVGGVTWTDTNGNLWLFGGDGRDANGKPTDLNDLWELVPSTGYWAWMGGSTASAGCSQYNLGIGVCPGQPGMYGTLGLPAAGNIPGGRSGAVRWKDANGDLWLFGGSGYDAADNYSYLNDLWKFNPIVNEWTWMGGSNAASACSLTPEGSKICEGPPGVYGTLGVPSATNDPGSRSGASGWVDSRGNFWLFGGYGSFVAGDYLGDLWRYQEGTAAAPDFSISALPPSLTLTPGQSGTVVITVTSLNGYDSVVSFSCSGLPAGVSCSFSPASVTPQATPVSTTLTVTTSASIATTGHNAGPLFSAVASALLLCCFGWKNRRSLLSIGSIVICGFCLSSLSGCRPVINPHSTLTTVIVTASSGSLQHTTSFALTAE